jgi:hypothetical protein
MIHFFVPADQAWIIENLRDRLSSEAAELMSVHTYLSAEKSTYLEPGSVIFTGLGVLTETQRKVAKSIWEHLDQPDAPFRLMNHPTQSLGRYELLTTLYEKGLNQFQAFRIHELAENEPTYPVFVREEFQHSGSLTGQIFDRNSLENTIEELCSKGYRRDHLLVVEFMDTSGSNGLFKKYSVQKMGDDIIPRYLTMDQHFVVKENTPPSKEAHLYSANQVEEEIEFMKENPHEEQLREIFKIAKIDFGRIDYGIKNGQIQTWEINTLPTFGSAPGTERSRKRKNRDMSKKLFYDWMSNTFLEIAAEAFGEMVELKIPDELVSRVRRERVKQKSVSLMVKAGEKLPRIPLVASLRTEIKRRVRNLKER